ncbi:RdgB/HAM1 family non-canonical purine NTP pyrophosphatase [Orrella sp. NBD-18]|uniref:dITP/XTP pyrophosphatase n=1 Tax=Sheuella amnicola TaxID=2707330 RepID=A0A6B2QV50_9BURK|nr:RdgB/HAM1 family non-canonical purine NTP pyrophosphatase [Sheuella amnicola]NDY81962.1 RdgB/HAM1 family non-canonical purine NTP pyrophosphatase [Sheuella amnicola]HBI83459.1 non-canonical purine NTP pyrophosphatase, RdgB/HAM1 family [Alcaligenaceae bacterium]
MTILNQVVLASSNPGKIKEFSALLNPLGIELIPQSTLGISDAQEPFLTFVENALAKARHASHYSGRAAMADDSGICVSALQGEPGVHSARFAEQEFGSRSDEANNRKLIGLLQDQADRSAWYVAVLVLVLRADDPQPIIAQAIWKGQIVDQPQGNNGFGYDPHFYLPEEGCTAASLSIERKNQISHRAKALKMLHAQLIEHNLIA